MNSSKVLGFNSKKQFSYKNNYRCSNMTNLNPNYKILGCEKLSSNLKNSSKKF